MSFVLEARVLSAYLGNRWLGIGIASGLELSKVLVILLYRVLRESPEAQYPWSVRGASGLFRLVLLGLSAACSVMFLAGQLDRPQLAAVRAADRAQIEQEYAHALAQAEANQARDYAQARTDFIARTEQRRQTLAVRYQPVIQDLERRLAAEMDNVVNGIFKGPRYLEWEARLRTEKTGYRDELATLNREIDQDRQRLETTWKTYQEQEIQRLNKDRADRLARVRAATYDGDERAEHPLARAFVGVLEAVFTQRPSTLQFVFFFALFLSLTLELGILVAFEHLALARLPVFAAEHRLGLDLRQQEARTAAEWRRFTLEEALARAKVGRKRTSIEDALRAEVDDKLAAHDTGTQAAVQ